MIEPVLPDVAGELIETIGHEIPEYSRPMEGTFGRGVYRGIGEALGQFVNLIRDPDMDRGPSREVYISLGRGEFTNGRALDALQSAYRIGARVAWRRIAAASLDAGLDGKTLSLLAESIFVYINELSADSTEGYADAQSEQQGERLRQERQLVIATLKSTPVSGEVLDSLARSAGWRLPSTASALACHERDLAEITRFLPIDVISAPVDALVCVIVPDPDGPGRLRQLEEAIGSRNAALGPPVTVAGMLESWNLARSTFDACEAGALARTGLVRAEEHLVDLALFKSRDLIDRLRVRSLGPLEDLTTNSRSRMVETAAAFIEHRGNAVEMAAALHIHPQTARYRIARLRELFGDRLDHPDSRFEIELSLRATRAGLPSA